MNLEKIANVLMLIAVFGGGILFICANAFSSHMPDKKGDPHDQQQ